MATYLPVVYWCPGCRKFLSRAGVSGDSGPFVTLMDDDSPFDSNDTFHWACFFCGFSQVPAEWGSFHGVPTESDIRLLCSGDPQGGTQLGLFG